MGGGGEARRLSGLAAERGGGELPKHLLQHACHGWVQLHHHPGEPPCEGRGCGAWKRPASWRGAGGLLRFVRVWLRSGRRRKGRWGRERWQHWETNLELALRWDENTSSAMVGIWRSGASGQPLERRWEKEGSGGYIVGEGRIGEAKNPGPGSCGAEVEGAGVMGVEEAWAAARSDDRWTPAWLKWSKQVVRPRSGGGGLTIDLVPPLASDEELHMGAREHGEWEEEEEEELEVFLQRCEVEAGLRADLDWEEAKKVSEDWKAWEAEATMAGITCPSTEEDIRRPEEEERPIGVSEVEIYLPPPSGQRQGADQRRGQRKGRQRWRPLVCQAWAGEPDVEELHSQTPEDEVAVDQVPVQPRPPRTRERRPRGRRQRGAPAETFEVDVLTFNGSGTPQAVAALAALSGSRRRVAAVLVQEHLARGDAVADLQHAVKGVGFKLAPNEAALGRGGGPSAGVAIAVPLHRGWGGIHGPCWDLSPLGSPGRLVGAWVQAGPAEDSYALRSICGPARA